ncbi:hypothetical protein CFP56_034823 [Quercus suber]|uniref:Uncharacterized protein n=1 Tax=Quercus suber TaxID=58331 RepID=A0AAW0LRT8_QUESU
MRGSKLCSNRDQDGFVTHFTKLLIRDLLILWSCSLLNHNCSTSIWRSRYIT